MKIKVIISIKNMGRISKFEHVTGSAADAFHAVEAVVMSPLTNFSEETKHLYLQGLMQEILDILAGKKLAYENWIIRLEQMKEGAQE